jgi:hypothetical protein
LENKFFHPFYISKKGVIFNIFVINILELLQIFLFSFFLNNMKHGIYFNNDSDNKDILSALAELNDTYLIENLSSNSENSASDSKVISNSDDIENFEENFKEIHLNNFEFVENSDNYIEDKIYDNLKLKVKEYFEKGKCLCKYKYFEKIGHEQFLARRVEFESLNKDTRDIVIKEQLLTFQQDKNTKKVSANNRKVVRCKYKFNNDLPICRNMY